MLCDSCEKFRFPYVDGVKEGRHGGQSGVSRKTLKTSDTRSCGSRSAVANTADSHQHVPLGEPLATNSAVGAPDSNVAASVQPPPEMIVSELLSYISFYRNKSTVDNLRRSSLSFFSPSDIGQAKKLLIGAFTARLGTCASTADRRNSTTRAAHEAEMDDLIAIFDILDLQEALKGYIFVAVNLDNLPKFGPEEINVAVVVERQVRTEAAISAMAASIDLLSTSCTVASYSAEAESMTRRLDDMQLKLEQFNSSVSARLDQLSMVCSQSLSSVSRQSLAPPEVLDRKMNIVIFGVQEDRDASIWRHSVDEILTYVTGHTVDIVDTFRLGRFADNSGGSQRKPRPILVKLRVAWDRRTILSRCSSLKHFHQRGIFIAADESIEIRRKNTFDRLKYRAERAGQRVAVADGKLLIDDVIVFSLLDGYVN